MSAQTINDQNNITILKFGGAALSEISSIQKVALIIKKTLIDYRNVVVVVSAMGKMTDQLLQLSYQVCSKPPKREQDMLISVGERISMSLLAMALDSLSIRAKSFTGSQSGIITSNEHLNAKIINVLPNRLIQAFDDTRVCIVAGFQGMSLQKEITTLGRGGSDTTAVALATALRCPHVRFYKDVKGVFSDDPKTMKNATFYSKLTYQQAKEMVQKNNRFVIHPRSLCLAEKNQIHLLIHSFLNPGQPGTIIGGEMRYNVNKMNYEHENSKSKQTNPVFSQ